MQLRLSRSQKTIGTFSKSVVFCLGARLDLTPEEAENVRKYKLGDQVIYNSAAAKKHLDSAGAALDRATAGGLFKAATSMALARLQLNITINSLTQGQHIECKDLDELLGAEEAVISACKTTQAYLDLASTFDGRETVIDFDATPELQAVA